MTPKQLVDQIDTIRAAYDRLIERCESLEDLEQIRISAVGKNGFFTTLQRELGKMIKEDRVTA